MTTTPHDPWHSWRWYWAEAEDAEVYHFAVPSTREGAIANARAEGYASALICEGIPAPLHDDFFRADDAIEQWEEANEDLVDEGGSLEMDPTPEQKAELQQALTAAWTTWRQKHKLGRAWVIDRRNKEVVPLDPAASEARDD